MQQILLILILTLVGCKPEPWEQDPCRNKRPIIETEQPDSMSVGVGTRISIYFTAQDFEGDKVWFVNARHNVPHSKHITDFKTDTAINAQGSFSFRVDDTACRGRTLFTDIVATDGKCKGQDTMRFKIYIKK